MPPVSREAGDSFGVGEVLYFEENRLRRALVDLELGVIEVLVVELFIELEQADG